MNERAAFWKAYESGELAMTRLCAKFEISPKTGYELVRRAQSEGVAGLEPRSRAPRRHPNRTPDEIVEAILRAERHRVRKK